MTECKLTKIHCWSFADSKGDYKANQKVSIYKAKDLIKAVSKQSLNTPGIRNCIDVRL